MAFTPISGTTPQYSTDDNALANDYWLKFYESGTTTPFSVAVNANGDNLQAKVKLNDEGYPISNPLDNATVFIPHIDRDYRIVLYRSEADADADNTGNAAFNIDGMVQNIAESGTAADVTIKGTTLLAQDDYDRSPLFVSGTDFTPGAGPHTITVPAGWTPSNPDARFYKVDSSGIVSVVTPTAKDSTSFVVSQNLLSTDVLFIGDDTFRNQMDGDPADIKARLGIPDPLLASNNLSDVGSAATSRTNLDVYSTSAVDSLVTPPAVAGYVGYTHRYRRIEPSSITFDLIGKPSLSFYSVGPTGSGADYTWLALDTLPAGTKTIIVQVRFFGDPLVTSVRDTANISFKANGGPTIEAQFYAGVELDISNVASVDSVTEVEFTVDANNVFVAFQQLFSSGSPDFDLRLAGFGI